jgi:hypothetical protein
MRYLFFFLLPPFPQQTRRNIEVIRRLICHSTKNFTRLGICPINQQDHAAIKPIAIPQKFGCRKTTSTLVAGKTENGCAFHRRRWNGTGTIQMAVITCAPRPRRRITRRTQFIVSRSVQEPSRGGKSVTANDNDPDPMRQAVIASLRQVATGAWKTPPGSRLRTAGRPVQEGAGLARYGS